MPPHRLARTAALGLAAGLCLPLLAGAAPLPPVPPATPPPPPLPPPPLAWSGGGTSYASGRHAEALSLNDGRGRVALIARDGPGERGEVVGPPEVLSYRDDAGREVRVYADHPITRPEAEALRAKARADGERAREAGLRAAEAGRRAAEDGRRAADEGRRMGEEGRRIGEEARARALASLGQREIRVITARPGEPPQVWVDGAPRPPVPFNEPEIRALRDEVRALREEVRGLRAELARERAAPR